MSLILCQACINLRPTAGVSCDKDGIHWYNIDIADIPIQKEIDAEVARLQQAEQTNKYKELRATEYPPMADYLDAIVKGDTAQQQAYIDACLAVKAKYPKGVA